MNIHYHNQVLLRFMPNSRLKIALVSLQAGKVGMSLTVANHEVILDLL